MHYWRYRHVPQGQPGPGMIAAAESAMHRLLQTQHKRGLEAWMSDLQELLQKLAGKVSPKRIMDSIAWCVAFHCVTLAMST